MGRLPHLSRMIIVIATPAARGTRKGNRVTALRWAGHLRALRHRVQVVEAWDGQPCDLLIALHATKSFPSVERYRARHPAAPLVVGLAGTDLYPDLPSSPPAPPPPPPPPPPRAPPPAGARPPRRLPDLPARTPARGQGSAAGRRGCPPAPRALARAARAPRGAHRPGLGRAGSRGDGSEPAVPVAGTAAPPRDPRRARRQPAPRRDPPPPGRLA